MEYLGLKIVLIAAAVFFYWFVYRQIRSNLRPGSRASMFSVGGRKRREERKEEEMSREDRIRQRKVSLREGSMFKRRFR